MKRYLVSFIITLTILGLTANAYPATNALAGKCYNAEVVDISGKKYFPAVKYAEIVYKDNDIQVMDSYGASEVAKAFGKISYRSSGNPKRSYRYVVGILQNEAQKNGL